MLIALVFFTKSNAQLGFCTGNSGDPIFVEDFGTAPSAAPQHVPLPAPGTTTYMFLGSPPGVFADGRYTVSNMNYQQWNWFNEEDHTAGDTNGRMLVVNASFTPGEFYRLPVTGLCENTTYTFSSWVKNLTPRDLVHMGGTPNPCDVRFEIWDSTNTILLKSGNTGGFLGSLSTETGEWLPFGLLFTTQVGQNSVILKMVNNGVGGYGNDLAIDDIEFKSCGDSIEIEDPTTGNSISLCSSLTPYSTTITAIPDNVVFSSHFYQWQSSADGTTWTDITGETNPDLNITGLTATTYYRTKVAESAVNVNNGLCNTISDVFEISITTAPPTPVTECWETASFNDTTCSWSVTGTQPTQPTIECYETVTFNTATCVWDVTGTQPVQPTLECYETASFNTSTCTWDVSGTQPTQPTIECYETATFNTATCVWDVTGTQPVQPTLECYETVTFNTSTCTWDVSGTQPTQPTIECYETTSFNNTTCVWDITGTPPVQPALECWETATLNNTTCTWDVSGSQPAQPTLECYETAAFNNSTCVWDVSGTQPAQPTVACWETATFNNTTCIWDVTGSQPNQPTLECWETATFNNTTCSWDISGTQPGAEFNETVVICSGDNPTLTANTSIPNPVYDWNTGAITSFISIDSPGMYSVDISSSTTCDFETRNFDVTQVESPIIDSVVSNGNTIQVNTSNTGNFLYSLDGIAFQSSNIFFKVPGGEYTVSVKEENCPDLATKQHLHFYIPKFFTPNGDTVNDTFDLKGITFYSFSQVTIFDRYGKLLKQAVNTEFSWDGTFNNQILPTGDYWYIIILDDQKFTGHVTLKR